MKEKSVLGHPKLYELYSNIKFEDKFKSLDFAEKMYLLERLGDVIKAFERSGKELNLSPEMVVEEISERGFSRTRKILEFCDKKLMELKTVSFEDPKTREDFKVEMKKKIFGI